MKNIKMIATVLLAGFIVQQPILSQTNAAEGQSLTAPPTASNAAQDTLVSNVLQDASAPANTAAPAATPVAAAPAVASGTEPVTVASGNTATNNDPTAIAPAGNAAAGSAQAAPPPMNPPGNPSATGATTGTASADAVAASPTNSQASASAPESGTNAPPKADAEMPISFQDVPITTAIETLARLAGINYLMDPKINYGQTDATGKSNAVPTLSIHWEKVTAKQALAAVLDNYGLQLIQNPQNRIAKITVKEPNAKPPLITRVIQLKYASTSNMLNAVQSMLSDPDHRSKVVGDSRTSQLVVIATEQEQTEVDALINKLDMPTRQVEIETKLVEMSSNPSTTKGIDWSGTLQAQHVRIW